MQPTEDILVLKKINKAFPGVKALTDMDFSLRRGEVHALVGENGAGKSTMMKILSGAYKKDSGTIFFEGSPLHDGAVIVREGKIAAAGCLLPLSPNLEISKDMGTRHRAALGLSEETDAVTVVVSEETGIVSLAKNGVLIRRLDRQNLYSMLTSELVPPVPESGSRKKLFGKVK